MNKIRHYFLLIFILTVLPACFPQHKVFVDNKSQYNFPQLPEGYDDTMAASFYFQNGFRLMNIYADSVNAIKNYRKALEYGPLHSASYYEMGNIFQYNNLEEALKSSYRANNLDKNNLWYKLQLGQFLIMSEKYDSALTVYSQIRKLAPNNPDNYRYLAALYEQTGELDKALAILDTAETRFGSIENIRTYKRLLLINAGYTERALEESKKMAIEFPYDDRNFVILGELYMREGKDLLAYDSFIKALEIDMHSVDALASLTDYYLRRNDINNFLEITNRLFDSERIEPDIKINFYNGVIANSPFFGEYYFRITELITTLLMRHPGNYDVMDLYAHHLLKTGNFEDPLNVYKESLTENIRLEALKMIIDLEHHMDRSDSVEKYTALAMENFPDNIDLYFRKSFHQLSAKQYRNSEKTLEKALKFADNDSIISIIYSSMGDIKYSEDSLNFKRIYPLYDKALQYYPDNVITLNNYSYYLSLEGKHLDKALTMIERVMELEPGNAIYIDTYGWILFRLGRFEEAKKVIRQAVSLDTYGNKELYFHYAEILYELKEYYLATVYWKKALEHGYNKDIIEERLKTVENLK